LLWGYAYTGKDGKVDMVKAGEEKAYRASRPGESVYGLERLSVLARPSKAPAEAGASYFEVYRKIYPL
ncbi:MAG: hypothetical protein FWB99_03950, partial [Treponema sp.]|nr:hypothetical protein [Treponema sp.]